MYKELMKYEMKKLEVAPKEGRVAFTLYRTCA